MKVISKILFCRSEHKQSFQKVEPRKKSANKPKNKFNSYKDLAETLHQKASDKSSAVLKKFKVKKNVVSNINIKMCEFEKRRQSSLYI